MKLRIICPTFTPLFLIVFSCFPTRAADDYKLGPDSMPQQGVPQGEVTKHK